MNNPEEQRKNGDLRGLGLALLIALPLYIFGTFNHDLWRPAEAREAGIAREMIENGNWVATYLNGNLFLEKPPLYTWAIALPLQWLGYREWVVRIPVFLFTLGTLVTVYWLARRRLGVIGAQGALVSLATMWLFLEVNHGAMIDNGLVFFVTLAMFAFHRMSEKPRLILGWAALFYGCLGLAFLCKGAVGPLLILVAVTGFVLSWRQWSLLRSWHPALGMLILLLLVGGLAQGRGAIFSRFFYR
jgi:4-amino-4-deoxy-L-arabinose transferase-like glycosyltransferase